MRSNDPVPGRARRLLLPMLGLALTASLAAAPPPAAAEEGPAPAARKAGDAERAKKAFRVAKRQLGDPYKYGAEGPDKFDCSGLVYFATHRAGFSTVPRTSSQQAEEMRRIKRAKLRRGDFVFFTSKGEVYHVGFYAGRRNGRRTVVHAPSSGKDVSRDPIWTDTWFAATLRGA